jgi:hypothetical protein
VRAASLKPSEKLVVVLNRDLLEALAVRREILATFCHVSRKATNRAGRLVDLLEVDDPLPHERNGLCRPGDSSVWESNLRRAHVRGSTKSFARMQRQSRNKIIGACSASQTHRIPPKLCKGEPDGC